MQKNTNSTALSLGLVLTLVSVFLCSPTHVSASSTQGTISSGSQYAWGENIGWIDLAPQTNGAYTGLVVTDSAVSGYAWSSTLGWINFSPTNSGQGVTNDGQGNLSGSAWIAGLGWLSMGGVSIDSNGRFTGVAGVASTTVGRLSFDCTHCEVVTDWRKASLRQAPAAPTNGPTGGGSVSIPNTSSNTLPTTIPDGAKAPLVNPSISSPITESSFESSNFSNPSSSGDSSNTLIHPSDAYKIVSTKLSDGRAVSVSIPTGSFSDDVQITITPEFLTEDNAPSPDIKTFLVGGKIFSIVAKDSTGRLIHKLNKEITISIDLPKDLLGAQSAKGGQPTKDGKGLSLYYLDETVASNPFWKLIPGAVFENGKINIKVNHLTRFAIFKTDVPHDTIPVLKGQPQRQGGMFSWLWPLTGWSIFWIVLLIILLGTSVASSFI